MNIYKIIEQDSLVYIYSISGENVSNKCLELSDKILTIIPLNSELVIKPYVYLENDAIVIEYDTSYGEFSLWVVDRDDFYVEWSFSVRNSDIYLDGFFINMEQIIYMTQKSIFGGHK